jgi:hypothetical protein
VRFGEFPGRIPLPSMVLTPARDAPVPPVIVKSKPCSDEAAPDCTVFDIDPHDVSAVASNYLDAIHRALGHYGFGISYGSTEHGGNGGWGGWGSFVGTDFGGVFLHELGHAMSFPHWGNDYALTDPAPDQYNYPYAGEAGEAGGGRGDSWSYLQQLGEFISPLCEDQSSDNFGLERSDAMQRSKHCAELRSTGQHEWDGFGDFSAAGTYRFFAGAAEPLAGSVPHRGGKVPFQLRQVMGIGQLRRNADGTRSVEYPPTATGTEGRDERLSVLFPQDWEAPASLIYGAYHPGFPEVNVVYGPVDFVGGLPEVVDPTDPEDFAELKAGSDGRFDEHFGSPRNFIVKISYENGSVLHALYPFEGFRAPGTPEGQGWTLGNGSFRSDVRYFAMVVPRPAQIMAVDVLYRPIVARGSSDMTEGNISNPALGLTPANILETAKVVTGWRR